MTEAESWGSVMILLKGSEPRAYSHLGCFLKDLFSTINYYFCFNNSINPRRIYILFTPVPHSVKRQEPIQLAISLGRLVIEHRPNLISLELLQRPNRVHNHSKLRHRPVAPTQPRTASSLPDTSILPLCHAINHHTYIHSKVNTLFIAVADCRRQ